MWSLPGETQTDSLTVWIWLQNPNGERSLTVWPCLTLLKINTDPRGCLLARGWCESKISHGDPALVKFCTLTCEGVEVVPVQPYHLEPPQQEHPTFHQAGYTP